MERNKKIIRVSFLGIFVNVLLVVFKGIVGFIANSISIILDAVNNLSDALTQVVTIIGAKLSDKKPTKKHPFGFGRIEYISNQIVAAIVIAIGAISLKESIGKIITPSTDTDYNTFAFIIISVSIVVKLVYGFYVNRMGNKLSSTALKATGTDAMFDSLLSLSTLICALIYVFGNVNIEGYVGCFISVMIIKAGIELMIETINSIIGNRIDSDLSTKIKEFITSYPEVNGAYDLIIHEYGPAKLIASVHIELNDNITASDIHRITREITERAYTEFDIILTVGIYASNDEQNELKEYIKSIISNYSTIKEMHGFYIDYKKNLVTFDLVFDFSENERPRIVSEITEKIKEKYSQYEIYVVLDNDFSD